MAVLEGTCSQIKMVEDGSMALYHSHARWSDSSPSSMGYWREQRVSQYIIGVEILTKTMNYKQRRVLTSWQHSHCIHKSWDRK